MTYRKFAWPSQAQFYTDMETAGFKSGELFVGCAVKELDPICKVRNQEGICTETDPRYAVDIVFYAEMPESFSQYVVWPNPVGEHIFLGLEWMYLRDFCLQNPDSPYCDLGQL
jgi:hypothetical protein